MAILLLSQSDNMQTKIDLLLNVDFGIYNVDTRNSYPAPRKAVDLAQFILVYYAIFIQIFSPKM